MKLNKDSTTRYADHMSNLYWLDDRNICLLASGWERSSNLLEPGSQCTVAFEIMIIIIIIISIIIIIIIITTIIIN